MIETDAGLDDRWEIAVEKKGQRGKVPNPDCSNPTKMSSIMDGFKTREHGKVGMDSVKNSTKPTKQNSMIQQIGPTKQVDQMNAPNLNALLCKTLDS